MQQRIFFLQSDVSIINALCTAIFMRFRQFQFNEFQAVSIRFKWNHTIKCMNSNHTFGSLNQDLPSPSEKV